MFAEKRLETQNFAESLCPESLETGGNRISMSCKGLCSEARGPNAVELRSAVQTPPLRDQNFGGPF